MNTLGKGLSTGLIIGLLGIIFSFSPLGLSIEEDLGLYWLFHQRGILDSPSQVAVVSIDKSSTDKLGIHRLPRKWSREIHGQLLDELKILGAKVVAFDFKFVEPRTQQGDQVFAQAIARFGNVVLFEQIQREVIDLKNKQGQNKGKIFKERRQPPLDIFTQQAAATAPFPLPKVPVKVSQFWAFKTSLGEIPTMPIVSLQTALWQWNTQLDQAIKTVQADWPVKDVAISREQLYQRAQDLRKLLANKHQWVNRILDELKANKVRALPELEVLLKAYAGPSSYYLNLYGPPRSIETFSYSSILEKDLSLSAKLKNRWVFVGFAEQLQPEQTDYFYTVFSGSDGVDISGVEITATALANLLQDNMIQPMSTMSQLFFIMSWSVILTIVVRAFHTNLVVILCASLAIAYYSWANMLFQHYYIWSPMVTPLMLQLPLILLVGFFQRHRDVNRERQRIQKAFGYYLPDHIVGQLAKGASISGHSDLVYGICLATDAEKYTTMSESLEPSQLREFMNEYYEQLFAPVRRHQGFISDVVGDAILAIWASPDNNVEFREHACLAAREMQDAIGRFNLENQYGLSLPTRVGVHCGEMMIGNVGALDHFEYRAVGDIVNSTNRIQSLNKHLKTQVLISHEVCQQLDALVVRDMGRFLLKGKSNSIHVYELLESRENYQGQHDELIDLFRQAMEYFNEQNWQHAFEAFQACSTQFPKDGPSQFYARLSADYLQAPSDRTWPGAVSVVNL